MLNRLLVVIDDQDSADVALWEALRLAEEHRGTLLLAGIVTRAATARIHTCVARGLSEAERRGLRATVHLFDPAPDAASVVSLASAEACDAIVIASHGRTAIGRLLAGSLIPGLITCASMPVLVCNAVRRDTPAQARVRAPSLDPISAFRQRMVSGAISGSPA